MIRWRIVMAVVLFLAIAVPAGLPFLELLGRLQAWRAWLEAERLGRLAGNTLALVTGTLALCLPAGVAGAVLLYRTDLPGRGLLRTLAVLTLFVPLPLLASAWQAALGTTGWLPLTAWRSPEVGAPWAQGLDAAIWVHAVAGLPWVIVLVGLGLGWVERELEEDALLAFGPWRVLWHVTLPRCRVTIAAAALWVALQTATEITVTDMMQVRTFAEEVYTQFSRPEPEPTAPGTEDVLARAVAVSLPAFLLTWALVVWAVSRWERTLPALNTLARPPWQFRLGPARLPCLLLALAVVGVLVGVPVASLVWKAGMHGGPPTWSLHVASDHLSRAFQVRGGLVAESLLLAAAAGVLTTSLGLLACWLALATRWFRAGLLLLIAAAWALPGPVLGLGLKDAVSRLLDVTRSDTLATVLYYGPSPVPVLWAYLLRFFPYAVAMLWPVVRLLPQELRDAARVDGAGPARELWHLVLPLTAPACVRAGLAVAILSLGELSAGKLVETPGSQTFAHEVFTQMHYGVTNDLAALCLLLLREVAVGGVLLALWEGWSRRWGRRNALKGPTTVPSSAPQRA
jgi:iron(III) transport system permease protein